MKYEIGEIPVIERKPVQPGDIVWVVWPESDSGFIQVKVIKVIDERHVVGESIVSHITDYVNKNKGDKNEQHN